MTAYRSLAVALMACSLILTACATNATSNNPQATLAAGGVTAGTPVGTGPTAAPGWTPLTQITPVSPLPGMFQSVGAAPGQPLAKVRVFFLGMQW
jgi:hypothetical protein